MKNIQILSLPILGLLLLASCSKPQPITAESMLDFSKLSTVEYTVSKVVSAQDHSLLQIFGDKRILFTTTSTLKAGINMAKLSDEDITIKGKSISIMFPAPEIVSMNMDIENIDVAYEETTGLRAGFTDELRNSLLEQGECDIIANADSLGIFVDAKRFATEFFKGFLEQAGYEDINIQYKEPEKIEEPSKIKEVVKKLKQQKGE
ncbi:MAG: DUF4230 domain-containing protein [Bacteroidales bacterium]|nr:DUF4230 domain-containing protein [Bacteroidales bacterium]